VRIRGALLIAYSFWFSLGRFFAPVALQVHSNVDRDNWLTPVYTQWSQIGLMLIIYLLVPETPAWCVTHGFEERAKKSLRKLHWEIKNYDVEHQYQVLVMAVNHEYEVARASHNEKWYSIQGNRWSAHCYSPLDSSYATVHWPDPVFNICILLFPASWYPGSFSGDLH
jgi:hypothetical protein